MEGQLYFTTDLSLSAFLQIRGHEIVEVRKEQGRGIFAFDDTPELKKDILTRIHATLNPGGYLILGASESLNGLPHLYEMVQCHPGIIYRKK